MSKIRNKGITDKWCVRHICYAATATQNLKDFRNFSRWTYSHLMETNQGAENKNTEFFDDISLIVSL